MQYAQLGRPGRNDAARIIERGRSKSAIRVPHNGNRVGRACCGGDRLRDGPTGAARPKEEPQAGSAGDVPPEFDLANPSLASFLEQLLQRRLAWPVIGFELEANGRVAATAEVAWPDRQIAVFGPELAADQEIFCLAGWRVFAFATAGLTLQDAETIVTILSAQR